MRGGDLTIKYGKSQARAADEFQLRKDGLRSRRKTDSGVGLVEVRACRVEGSALVLPSSRRQDIAAKGRAVVKEQRGKRKRREGERARLRW